MVSLDTDCIMAEVMGMFKRMAGSSTPLRYLTKGVRKDTLLGIQSSEVYPGMSRYSLKVWDGSLQ